MMQTMGSRFALHRRISQQWDRSSFHVGPSTENQLTRNRFEKHWKDIGEDVKTDKPLYSGRMYNRPLRGPHS